MSTPPAQTQVGWFGKLPAAGDFVGRGLPREAIAMFDAWLQQALQSAQLSHGADWERLYDAAPMWNFILPAAVGAGTVQFGVIAPSSDRVGRRFPLVVALALRPPFPNFRPFLEDAIPFFSQIGRVTYDVLRHAKAPAQLESGLAEALPLAAKLHTSASAADALKEILSVLGEDDDASVTTVNWSRGGAMPWNDLHLVFDPMSDTSYWWTNQAGNAPLLAFAHQGGLNPQLLTNLFAHPVYQSRVQREGRRD